MTNQPYTKDDLLDIILEVAYPDPQERKAVDRAKVKSHFDEFYSYIDHCSRKQDFLDCLKDYELEFMDLISDILKKTS